MLHIVIDSNIYLRFYAYPEDTLEELEKLYALAQADQISIYVTSQIADEVARNREAEIARALEKFQKSALPAEVPRFAAHLNEAKTLVRPICLDPEALLSRPWQVLHPDGRVERSDGQNWDSVEAWLEATKDIPR